MIIRSDYCHIHGFIPGGCGDEECVSVTFFSPVIEMEIKKGTRKMKDLYYVTSGLVRSVPYTRDRAMSVGVKFHENRRDALIEAKQQLEADVQDKVERMMAIERELANVFYK